MNTTATRPDLTDAVRAIVGAKSAAALAITEGDDYRPSGEGVRLYLTVSDLEALLARAVAARPAIAIGLRTLALSRIATAVALV